MKSLEIIDRYPRLCRLLWQHLLATIVVEYRLRDMMDALEYLPVVKYPHYVVTDALKARDKTTIRACLLERSWLGNPDKINVPPESRDKLKDILHVADGVWESSVEMERRHERRKRKLEKMTNQEVLKRWPRISHLLGRYIEGAKQIKGLADMLDIATPYDFALDMLRGSVSDDRREYFLANQTLLTIWRARRRIRGGPHEMAQQDRRVFHETFDTLWEEHVEGQREAIEQGNVTLN